jgi:hypothetical protein
MRRILLFPFVIILAVSCQEPKEEVIDMNDIIPQSKNYKDGDPESKDSLVYNDFGFNHKLAIELGIDVMEVDSFPQPMFPDRFTPKSIQKLSLQFKEDAVFFGQWTFKDSIKTMNALFNWMDCFGPKCKSIKYLQPAKFQAESMVIFVNDTSITYLSSTIKLDKVQWQQYLETNNGVDFWDLVIVQKKNGKAEWEYYGALKDSEKKQFLPLIE